MGKDSKIEWTDHTFSAWLGCTKTSDACTFCYAEGWAKRSGLVKWGPGEPRRKTSAANWKKPLKWDREAAAKGERARVFANSLSDVFDAEVPDEWRDELFALIACTPNLDWMLLTKRPKVMHRFVSHPKTERLSNLWLGVTAENQTFADQRIPILLKTPAAKRFVSIEPMLGPVDLTMAGAEVDLVITGGESGPHARPMHPDWPRALRDQCVRAGVAFHFKQWGEWAPHKPVAGGDLGGDARRGRVRIVHPTGQSSLEVSEATGGMNTIPGSRYMARVGKKRAGRLLGGREWNEMPGGAV